MSNCIETREQRIMRPLLEFFAKEVNLKILLDIVVFKTRNIPLRLLDWFVTNYSKKNDICYHIKRPNNTLENFYVFRSYRAQLKSYKKKEFDPFCRGSTIVLQYESPTDEKLNVVFETAICQLKFFKWSIENLVLNYVESNYTDIYNDMKTNSSKSQKTTQNNTKKKKTELSKSIFQQVHVSNKISTFNFPQSKIDC